MSHKSSSSGGILFVFVTKGDRINPTNGEIHNVWVKRLSNKSTLHQSRKSFTNMEATGLEFDILLYFLYLLSRKKTPRGGGSSFL
jgi:hypothetical protein